MKKSDIAGRVADRIGVSRAAAGNAVDAAFEAVGEALANGEEVRIVGFGTFAAKSRAARTGHNPRTGESLEIQASRAPAFKPGKALKDAVNDGNRSCNGPGEGSETRSARDARDVEPRRFRCDDGCCRLVVAVAVEMKRGQGYGSDCRARRTRSGKPGKKVVEGVGVAPGQTQPPRFGMLKSRSCDPVAGAGGRLSG